jgi:hypothetical protein
MKNTNLSLLDSEQMTRQEHDITYDAKRVVIVGDTGKQIAESIKDGLKDLKIDLPKEERQEKIVYIPEPKIIEVPVIVKEIDIREIEKPIIITEVKIVEIEKPIIVPEIKVVEIEKQVIVKEFIDLPLFIKYTLIAQAIATVVMALISIIVHKP